MSPMFGSEVEYAFTAFYVNGNAMPPNLSIPRLLNVARAELIHLPGGGGGGMFLSCGRRLYCDCLHPELTTPECTSPDEFLRYLVAGDRLMFDLANKLQERSPDISKVEVYRFQVDYSGTRSTWGCHESYLHRVDPRMLPDSILGHLVSRIVYTGPGGFNNLSPGLEFLIEPRVPHLGQALSASSTGGRGIYHTKNETLSSPGFNRLHVLASANTCSHLATWLKVGTTSLIVLLADHGYVPRERVRPASPVEAMNTYARDMHCRKTVPMADATQKSAIELQRIYLDAVVQRIKEPFMPEWAERVCAVWTETLDGLSASPESLATRLDWLIKRNVVFDQYLRDHGLDCTWLTQSRVSPQSRLNYDSIRNDLFALDARFGQLGDEDDNQLGTFNILDNACDENGNPLLSHRIVDLPDLDHAVDQPPSFGRATVRGEWIRKLFGQSDLYCTWTNIIDQNNRQMLDFANPFASDASWTPLQSQPRLRPTRRLPARRSI